MPKPKADRKAYMADYMRRWRAADKLRKSALRERREREREKDELLCYLFSLKNPIEDISTLDEKPFDREEAISEIVTALRKTGSSEEQIAMLSAKLKEAKE